MKQLKKIIIIILCICFLAGPLFDLFYICEHVEHECTGRECRVCAQIEIATISLYNYESFLVIAAFCILAAICLYVCNLKHINIAIPHKTLVSLNVELLE